MLEPLKLFFIRVLFGKADGMSWSYFHIMLEDKQLYYELSKCSHPEPFQKNFLPNLVSTLKMDTLVK